MELSGYQLNVLIVAALYVLMAVGLQLTTGYAGQISLGHAGFYALGAYAAALASTQAGWRIPRDTSAQRSRRRGGRSVVRTALAARSRRLPGDRHARHRARRAIAREWRSR